MVQDYWASATVRYPGATGWSLFAVRIKATSLLEARHEAIQLIGEREYGELQILYGECFAYLARPVEATS